MRVQITDPVNEAIPGNFGDFDEEWATIGSMVKLMLMIGDKRISWCNVSVTHDGDSIGNCTLHRTIAVD